MASKKATAGKKNAARKGSNTEVEEAVPTIDRNAKIVCPYPEWDEEYVRQLISKGMARVNQEEEDGQGTIENDQKNAAVKKGTEKLAKKGEVEEYDLSIINFEPQTLELDVFEENGEVIWKSMNELSKVRLLRSRAPVHPYMKDHSPLVAEDAGPQKNLKESKRAENTKRIGSKTLLSAEPEDSASITEEMQSLNRLLKQQDQKNMRQDYHRYADFPTLEPKGQMCRAFESVLYAIKYHYRLVPQGHYLWEGIYPKANGSSYLPQPSPFGKYIVKMWYMGAFRMIIVDDLLPYTVEGKVMAFPETKKGELWPALIFKALLTIARENGGEQQLFNDPLFTLQSLFPGYVRQTLSSRNQLAYLRAVRETIDIMKQQCEMQNPEESRVPDDGISHRVAKREKINAGGYNRILCATCKLDHHIQQDLIHIGLNPRKLYLISEVAAHKGQTLLRMMVRKISWKGELSYEDASLWTADFEESIGFLRQDQETLSSHVNDFWITIDEFTRFFEGVHVMHDMSALKHRICLTGSNLPNGFFVAMDRTTMLALQANLNHATSVGHTDAEQSGESQKCDSSEHESLVLACSMEIYDWTSDTPFTPFQSNVMALDNTVHVVPISFPPDSSMQLTPVDVNDANSSQAPEELPIILKFKTGDSNNNIVLELLTDKEILHIGNEREILKNVMQGIVSDIVEPFPELHFDGRWQLWFMKDFQVQKPMLFSSAISMSPSVQYHDKILASTQFGVVNLETGEYIEALINRILPTMLQPNNGKGYIMVAYSKLMPLKEFTVDDNETRTIPPGNCQIHTICDNNVDFDQISSTISGLHRVELSSMYVPNYQRALIQYNAVVGEPCYSALHLELSHKVPATFEIMCNAETIFQASIPMSGFICVPPIALRTSTKAEAVEYTYQVIINEQYASQLLRRRFDTAKDTFSKAVGERLEEVTELPPDPEEEERKIYDNKKVAANATKKKGRSSERKPADDKKKNKASIATTKIPSKQTEPSVIRRQQSNVGKDINGGLDKDALACEMQLLFSSPNVILEEIDPKSKKLEEYKEEWEKNAGLGRLDIAKETRERFYIKKIRQEYFRLKALSEESANTSVEQEEDESDDDRRNILLKPAKAQDPEWLKRGASSWMYNWDEATVMKDEMPKDREEHLTREEIEARRAQLEQEMEQRKTALQEEQQRRLRESETQLRTFLEQMKIAQLEQQHKRIELVQQRQQEQQQSQE